MRNFVQIDCGQAPFHESLAMSLPPLLQNLRIPVVASPLFIVSNPELVIA